MNSEHVEQYRLTFSIQMSFQCGLRTSRDCQGNMGIACLFYIDFYHSGLLLNGLLFFLLPFFLSELANACCKSFLSACYTLFSSYFVVTFFFFFLHYTIERLCFLFLINECFHRILVSSCNTLLTQIGSQHLGHNYLSIS